MFYTAKIFTEICPSSWELRFELLAFVLVSPHLTSRTLGTRIPTFAGEHGQNVLHFAASARFPFELYGPSNPVQGDGFSSSVIGT